MTDETKSPAPGTITARIADGCLSVAVAGTDDGFGNPVSWIVNPALLDPAIREAAMLHGLKQKLCDAAALGKDATPAEKVEAIRAVHAALTDPEAPTWNRKAGDGTSGDGLLVRALQRVAGLDRDAARKAVAGMDKKTQAAMLREPEVAVVVAELKAADAARQPAPVGVDTQGLLARLRNTAA
jgi:hypothetical protein